MIAGFIHRTLVYLLGLGLATHVFSQTMLTTLRGERFSLEHLKGKWVVFNYWASWCQPCIDEIRELNRFYRHHQNKVALYGVNYEQISLQEQEKLVNDYHIRYPSLRYDDAILPSTNGLIAIPATVIFNPDGKWVKTLYGPQTEERLSRYLF